MTPELEALLKRRHPRIFEATEDVEQWPITSRGIECADGWFNLIDVLCACLQMATDCSGDHQVVAVQVKEKMGALRFHVSNASERQLGMIDLATMMSSRTCELCGEPGQRAEVSGTVLTRCLAHLPSDATVRERRQLPSTPLPGGSVPLRSKANPEKNA